jgi:alginate O-acetyltransferase complex protein AlgI
VLQEFAPVWLMLLAGYIIHWLPNSWKMIYREAYIKSPLVVKILVGFGVFTLLYQVLSAELQPFIYFAF